MVKIKLINLTDDEYNSCKAIATNEKGERLHSYDMFMWRQYDEVCLEAINKWHTNQKIIEICRNRTEIKIIYQE